MVIISKDILKNNISFLRTGLFFLLLCLNHNAISIGVCVTYLLLTKRESLFKLISIIITSQLLGNFLIQYYLEAINFSGRGRLRFVFNDNVIENAVNFVGSNFLIVLWSGFFGSILIMVLVFNTLPWMEVKKLLISLLIALFFTSIALDTSRIFSLLVVPIIIHTLNLYKNRVDFNKKLAITYTVSLLLVTVVGVFFIHGSVLTSSPMNELENFYDFIPRIVNSVMSTIWK